MRNNEEDILQRQVEDYLKLYDLKYVHIPKQLQQYIWGKGRKSIPVHIAVMASKAFKGVPDLLIFDKSNRKLILELKSAKGKLTPEQKEWEQYGMVVVKTFEDAKYWIDMLFNI